MRSANSDAGTPSVSRSAFSMNSKPMSSRATTVSSCSGSPAAIFARYCFGCFQRSWRTMRSAKRELRVRARADAEIVAELPVVQVVPARAARLRVRRRLVVRVARARERCVHRAFDVRRRVLVGQRRRRAMEQRVGLERQVIERQVRRRERERRGEVGLRALDRLLRQPVHQVEVDVAEDHERGFGGAARLVVVVHAAERAQLRGIEALDAERQAIDAGREEVRRTSAARTCRDWLPA